MVRRQKLLPPTQFTLGDKVRLFMGALILLLGIALLWRTLPLGVSPQAILVCGAFIGFGTYRLWLGYTRLKQFRRESSSSSSEIPGGLEDVGEKL
jgi:hypothetical protein